MKRILLFISLIMSLLGLHSQDTDKPVVALLKVQDNIDPRTNRYTELGIDFAREQEADFIVLELDTYGGALNDADEIRTRLLNLDIPIYAYINKDAASAGALISIACDSIYMARGSSIGAATVVVQDGSAAPDKYQSYMRSIMRSTAEARGRDPRIAEAMVDEDIEVDSISQEGKVLTLSVSEAIRLNYCEAEVTGVEDIMKRSGVTDYELKEFTLGATEKIISFFLNPFVSGILILVIIGGIYFELQTPGVGFPILASVVAAVLYFTPYYLNGLAENWELVMFVVGLALLAVEIFVIPGFGIAGIAGLICTLGALVLVMINNDGFSFDFVDPAEIFKAISTTLAGLMGAIIVMFIGGVRLLNSNVFKRISLADVQLKDEGYTSSFYSNDMVGRKGTTYTVLRPSGKILIDGEIYDAYTRGNYIDSGQEVEVISADGTSLKVKEV